MIIAALSVFPFSATASNVAERLEYDLIWFGIKAGDGALEVAQEDNNMVRMLSTAKSADWVNEIYPVEDRVTSIAENKKPMVALNYKLKNREGKRVRDKEVIFERSVNKAKAINHHNPETEEFHVPEVVYDPLTAFYAVRSMELTVGKSAFLPVFDSKRIYELEIEVLRKEQIRVPAGIFNTIVIRPVMKSEGIFLSKGAIYIWLSDDAKKIPIKMKTKVAVGSVNAVLKGGFY